MIRGDEKRFKAFCNKVLTSLKLTPGKLARSLINSVGNTLSVHKEFILKLTVV
ncbi:MAG: hypothetical protein ACFB02_09115 [Mastigocoleus sp.]